MTTEEQQETRRKRLAQIAAEYTQEIYDPESAAQLRGEEPVAPFAAITSEGSAESSFASNGNLLVAGSAEELAELLRREADEGWLCHGHAWDLDGDWHGWGNLAVTYEARVGSESRRSVGAVTVEGRLDGLYLFLDDVDAKAFRDAVRREGGEAEISEEPLLDHAGAEALIEAERKW